MVTQSEVTTSKDRQWTGETLIHKRPDRMQQSYAESTPATRPMWKANQSPMNSSIEISLAAMQESSTQVTRTSKDLIFRLHTAPTLCKATVSIPTVSHPDIFRITTIPTADPPHTQAAASHPLTMLYPVLHHYLHTHSRVLSSSHTNTTQIKTTPQPPDPSQ